MSNVILTSILPAAASVQKGRALRTFTEVEGIGSVEVQGDVLPQAKDFGGVITESNGEYFLSLGEKIRRVFGGGRRKAEPLNNETATANVIEPKADVPAPKVPTNGEAPYYAGDGRRAMPGRNGEAMVPVQTAPTQSAPSAPSAPSVQSVPSVQSAPSVPVVKTIQEDVFRVLLVDCLGTAIYTRPAKDGKPASTMSNPVALVQIENKKGQPAYRNRLHRH